MVDIVREAQTSASILEMTHVVCELSLLFELARIEGAYKIDRTASLSHDSLHGLLSHLHVACTPRLDNYVGCHCVVTGVIQKKSVPNMTAPLQAGVRLGKQLLKILTEIMRRPGLATTGVARQREAVLSPLIVQRQSAMVLHNSIGHSKLH